MSGFESGELSNSSNLVPVLARLLEFSPADTRKVAGARPRSWMDGLPVMSNAGSVIGSNGGPKLASIVTPGIFSSMSAK